MIASIPVPQIDFEPVPVNAEEQREQYEGSSDLFVVLDRLGAAYMVCMQETPAAIRFGCASAMTTSPE